MKVFVLLVTTLVAVNAQFMNPRMSQLLQEKIDVQTKFTKGASTREVNITTVIQRVDHFNPQDTRTWNQRIFSIDQFYQPGGPIYLFLGGIGDFIVDPDIISIEGLLLNDIVNQTNGIIYNIENRYFGQSIPTEYVNYSIIL